MVFCRSPDESLMPMMFGTSASRATVSGSMLEPAAGGRVVVEHDRQLRALGDAAEVVEQFGLRRLDEVRA